MSAYVDAGKVQVKAKGDWVERQVYVRCNYCNTVLDGSMGDGERVRVRTTTAFNVNEIYTKAVVAYRLINVQNAPRLYLDALSALWRWAYL